ncbi:MAG: NAD(P)-dependent oxidoreductase [Deltaproteobacteria bacterium]|nr:NAD(P)-dependent oxidoreductase [Deltaproteobacteria bacterium]
MSASRPSEIIAKDASYACGQIDFSGLNSKTILITGATGLLGLHFLACIKHLVVQKKLRIKVQANIHSEPDTIARYFLKGNHIEIIRGDLSDEEYCHKLLPADYILHLAGYAQPNRFMSDALRTLRINTVGTISLLQKLKPGGKFLFASSADVYTGLTSFPFREDQVGTTGPGHPRACYIEGKKTGETACHIYFRNGVDAKSARLGLIFGPGTRKGDTRVLNSLIEKGLKGSVALLDEGRARRTFLYVSDAVQMMWRVLLFGHESIYNVGGKDIVSILELAKMIGSNLNIPVALPENPQSIPGAPDSVILDVSRFEKEFGPLKLMSFGSALERTIEWQRHLYKQ